MNLLYIDLFCGAGGTSTGITLAHANGEQCAKVIACVNHDKNAIASHATNHPDALHFAEDIRTLDLSPLVKHLESEKRKSPHALVVLWASLECTNFSKAKGGQPRDADSRTLAEHLFRYIEALKPDYIQIENVEEFMSWGELNEHGRPISRYKGQDYLRWIYNVCMYGYEYDYRILNAADYGAYTSRSRFFGIFAKNGLPIVFPEPTHAKKPQKDLFGHSLKQWQPVRDCLNFVDEGTSIFERKKPLAEATLQRIHCGLVKFVAGGKDKFLIKYNSMHGGKCNPPSIDEPCPTIAVQTRLNIARVDFLTKNYSGNPEGKAVSVDSPSGAITTIDHHSFISAYYSNGDNVSEIDRPSPTVTTNNRLAKVTSFFANQYSGGGQLSSISEPCPTITTTPKQNIVSTIHCRQEKNHADIIEHDSFTMVKIKEFMQLYGIADIKMRMLRVPELKQIMGFPIDYVLLGNQSEQKKFIGNAVEVNMARVLCEALASALDECRAVV